MGRVSTWHNRATIPLRIPRIFAKAGDLLFRGIDAFTVDPEKASDRFEATVEDGAGQRYNIEMIVTRIPTEMVIATAETAGNEVFDAGAGNHQQDNNLEPEGITPIPPESNTEATLNTGKISSASTSANNLNESSPVRKIADILLVDATAESGSEFDYGEVIEDIDMITATKTSTETTQDQLEPVFLGVVVEDEKILSEPPTQAEDPPLDGLTTDASVVLLPFNLTEFGNQIYKTWHRLAENTQLPVWGHPIELDDIYRHSFGSMPGELFLKYLQRLVEQEASQRTARIGLVHIPGQPSFTVGSQQVCALTFWLDWFQAEPTEVNNQPTKRLVSHPGLSESGIQKQQQTAVEVVAQNPEREKCSRNGDNLNQFAEGELQRLRTVLAQLPSASSTATTLVPATTTIERLRAERQHHLQHIQEMRQQYSAQNLRSSVKLHDSGLVAGLINLIQKVRI